MQNKELVNKVINIVKKYYKNEFQSLNIGLERICFCQNDSSCTVKNYSPITIPEIETNKVKIHINSEIDPSWFPSQIVFQFSHELWHAYEFSRYGVEYPWKDFEKETEPYAYAASLCILSENIIPKKIYSLKSQKQYFDDRKLETPEKPVYEPGVKIAQDINYNFKKLCSMYNKRVVPLIEQS